MTAWTLADSRTRSKRAFVIPIPGATPGDPTVRWVRFEWARGRPNARVGSTSPAGIGVVGRWINNPLPRFEPSRLHKWLDLAPEPRLRGLRSTLSPARMWWGSSQSPQTSGAVARHQLQQVAVHTYDAQVAAGAPQPLPTEVALDGVDEFLTTCVATTAAWRVWLSADGARAVRLPASAGAGTEAADVSAWGTANELVMFCYGRIQMDSLRLEGDRGIFDQLIA
ncbi:maleylpyruvate isomerase N-terminal domain-containing protein [Asanoa sp. NPDC049518]|uniref:maleylpyruvate isomerase N-terminal domain-containing protein n=1 Tax=unclassified Asanoa TaxID=2685164 RepID=UPI00341B82A8